jgi:8-oxo-dGTP pyrophosphatase MutT (NUDIX family)
MNKDNKKFKFKKEHSAGLVVFKKQSSGKNKKIYFLLGKHSGYHKWVLPKGLIEKGEKGYETALRETKEEMAVTAKLLQKKPVHKISYVYVADFENKINDEKEDQNKPERRVKQYQEQGGQKTKVFKTVLFYLGEYRSGDPKDHGWEMEKALWLEYEKVLEKLAFKGEKEALKKARQRLKNL